VYESDVFYYYNYYQCTWFKRHCHVNDARALYKVIITVRRVVAQS